MVLPTYLGVGNFTDSMQIKLSADNVKTHRQTYIQNFSFGGGSSPEAICNLCLIFKTYVVKIIYKYNSNITVFATAFVHCTFKYSYMFT